MARYIGALAIMTRVSMYLINILRIVMHKFQYKRGSINGRRYATSHRYVSKIKRALI